MNTSQYQFLLSSIDKELKMCTHYSFYHSALYYLHDMNGNKIKTIRNIVYKLLVSYQSSIQRANKRSELYYEVLFKNGSRFFVIPFYDGQRGLRNNHILIDGSISIYDIETILYPMLIDWNTYEKCFEQHNQTDYVPIDLEDKKHFGNVTIISEI